MTAVMVFVGVLVAIVVVGFVVSRVRGGRAHYLDAWSPEAGERTLVDDPAADFYVVPRMGQARKMSFARMHRTHAVLTDRRLIVAVKVLFGRRHMITHMVLLQAADAPPGTADRLSGGLLDTGYIVLVASPAGMRTERDGDKPYLRIDPDSTASSATIEHCRLYSDLADRFQEAAGSSG